MQDSLNSESSKQDQTSITLPSTEVKENQSQTTASTQSDIISDLPTPNVSSGPLSIQKPLSASLPPTSGSLSISSSSSSSPARTGVEKTPVVDKKTELSEEMMKRRQFIGPDLARLIYKAAGVKGETKSERELPEFMQALENIGFPFEAVMEHEREPGFIITGMKTIAQIPYSTILNIIEMTTFTHSIEREKTEKLIEILQQKNPSNPNSIETLLHLKIAIANFKTALNTSSAHEITDVFRETMEVIEELVNIDTPGFYPTPISSRRLARSFSSSSSSSTSSTALIPEASTIKKELLDLEDKTEPLPSRKFSSAPLTFFSTPPGLGEEEVALPSVEEKELTLPLTDRKEDKPQRVALTQPLVTAEWCPHPLEKNTILIKSNVQVPAVKEAKQLIIHLIDVSGSMKAEIPRIQSGVRQFTEKAIKEGHDVIIAIFDQMGTIVADTRLSKEAIPYERIATKGSTTDLTEGLKTLFKHLKSNKQKHPYDPSNTTLMLVIDGVDYQAIKPIETEADAKRVFDAFFKEAGPIRVVPFGQGTDYSKEQLETIGKICDCAHIYCKSGSSDYEDFMVKRAEAYMGFRVTLKQALLVDDQPPEVMENRGGITSDESWQPLYVYKYQEGVSEDKLNIVLQTLINEQETAPISVARFSSSQSRQGIIEFWVNQQILGILPTLNATIKDMSPLIYGVLATSDPNSPKLFESRYEHEKMIHKLNALYSTLDNPQCEPGYTIQALLRQCSSLSALSKSDLCSMTSQTSTGMSSAGRTQAMYNAVKHIKSIDSTSKTMTYQGEKIIILDRHCNFRDQTLTKIVLMHTDSAHNPPIFADIRALRQSKEMRDITHHAKGVREVMKQMGALLGKDYRFEAKDYQSATAAGRVLDTTLPPLERLKFPAKGEESHQNTSAHHALWNAIALGLYPYLSVQVFRGLGDKAIEHYFVVCRSMQATYLVDSQQAKIFDMSTPQKRKQAILYYQHYGLNDVLSTLFHYGVKGAFGGFGWGWGADEHPPIRKLTREAINAPVHIEGTGDTTAQFLANLGFYPKEVLPGCGSEPVPYRVDFGLKKAVPKEAPAKRIHKIMPQKYCCPLGRMKGNEKLDAMLQPVTIYDIGSDVPFTFDMSRLHLWFKSPQGCVDGQHINPLTGNPVDVTKSMKNGKPLLNISLLAEMWKFIQSEVAPAISRGQNLTPSPIEQPETTEEIVTRQMALTEGQKKFLITQAVEQRHFRITLEQLREKSKVNSERYVSVVIKSEEEKAKERFKKHKFPRPSKSGATGTPSTVGELKNLVKVSRSPASRPPLDTSSSLFNVPKSPADSTKPDKKNNENPVKGGCLLK